MIARIVTLIAALLAVFFGVYSIAYAVQITVPSASGSGFMLISTTTGAYISTSTNPLTIGSVFATTTATSSLPNITQSGGLLTKYICLSSDTCRTTWPTAGSGVWPFTTTNTNYGVPVQSTTTPEFFQNGMMASTTSFFVYSTTTAGTFLSNLYVPYIAKFQLIETDANSNLIATGSIGYNMITGTPAIPIAANPTASVGLNAANGSAATFMRSDAAPALDQTISPTMTGAWAFNNAASTTIAKGLYANTVAAAYLLATSTTATSTFSGNLTVTGNFEDDSVKSALILDNAAGLAGAYGGTSCTNQFIRSLSALGAASCASVANTDLVSSSVTINTSGGLTGGGSLALGGTLNLVGPGDPFTHPIPAQSATSTTLYFTGGLVALASSTLGFPSATTTILGPLMIGTTAFNGTMLGSSTMLQISSSTNNFLQAIIQNTNTGTDASADLVFNNNLSTNSAYYGELGINGGGFGNSLFSGESPNDLFMVSSDGAVDITAASSTLNAASSSINFFTGGTTNANLRGKLNGSGNWAFSSPATSTFASGLYGNLIAAPYFDATNTAATSSLPALSFNVFAWAGSIFSSFSSAFTSSTGVLSSVIQPSFTYFATSTTMVGTTTITLQPKLAVAETVNSVSCEVLNGGVGTTNTFLNIQLGSGSASTTMVQASSTIGTVPFSANNTFSIGSRIRVDIGTTTSITVTNPMTVSCQYKITI